MLRNAVLGLIVVCLLAGSSLAGDEFKNARTRLRSKDAPTKLRGVRDMVRIDSADSVRALERVIKASSDALEKKERELERVLAAQLRMLPKLRRLIRRADAGKSIVKDADRVLDRCDELEREVKRLQRDTRFHLGIVKTAGEGFLRFRDPAAIKLIEKGALTEFNTMVRIFYIAGMRHSSRRSSVPALLEALGSSDPRIRAALTRALIPFAREPGVFEAMKPLVADKHWAVRLGAYQVIAGAPFAQAVEQLCRATAIEKGEVAFAINAYLEQLTGGSFRQEPAQWSVWWRTNGPAIYKGTWRPQPRTEKHTGETKTVALFFGIPITSRRILFAIDFSNSMSAPVKIKDSHILRLIDKYKLKKTRLGYAKAEFMRALAGLPDGAKFALVGYNDDVRMFSGGRMMELNKSSRKSAVRWITRLKTADLTNIFSAINAAFKDYLGPSGARKFVELPDTVLLLTDGIATRGRFTETRDILDMAEIWNGPLDVVFHCVGIGKGHDSKLLKELSSSTGGFYVDVSGRTKSLKPRTRKLPEGLVFDAPPLPPAEADDESDEEPADFPETPVTDMPRNVRKLVEQFEDGGAPERIAAAKALGALGATAAPAADVLVEALSDFREDVRTAAANALGKLGSGAVPALIDAIESGDPDVIVGAANALTAMGSAGRAAAKALQGKIDDADEGVRVAARGALAAVQK